MGMCVCVCVCVHVRIVRVRPRFFRSAGQAREVYIGSGYRLRRLCDVRDEREACGLGARGLKRPDYGSGAICKVDARTF